MGSNYACITWNETVLTTHFISKCNRGAKINTDYICIIRARNLRQVVVFNFANNNCTPHLRYDVSLRSVRRFRSNDEIAWQHANVRRERSRKICNIENEIAARLRRQLQIITLKRWKIGYGIFQKENNSSPSPRPYNTAFSIYYKKNQKTVFLFTVNYHDHVNVLSTLYLAFLSRS